MRKKRSIVLLAMLCLCVILSGCAGVVTLDGLGTTSLEDTTLTGQYSTMQLKFPKVKENDRADILGAHNMETKSWSGKAGDTKIMVEVGWYDPAKNYWINLDSEVEDAVRGFKALHFNVENVTNEQTTLDGRAARKIDFDYSESSEKYHCTLYIAVVDNKELWAIAFSTKQGKEMPQEVLDSLKLAAIPKDASIQQKIAENTPQVAIEGLNFEEDDLHFKYLCLKLKNTDPQRTIANYRVNIYKYDRNGQLVPEHREYSSEASELCEYHDKILPGQYTDERKGWRVHPKADIGKYEVELESITYTDGSEWKAVDGQQIRTSVSI